MSSGKRLMASRSRVAARSSMGCLGARFSGVLSLLLARAPAEGYA